MAYDAEIQILVFPKTISNREAQISIVSQENEPINSIVHIKVVLPTSLNQIKIPLALHCLRNANRSKEEKEKGKKELENLQDRWRQGEPCVGRR